MFNFVILIVVAASISEVFTSPTPTPQAGYYQYQYQPQPSIDLTFQFGDHDHGQHQQHSLQHSPLVVQFYPQQQYSQPSPPYPYRQAVSEDGRSASASPPSPLTDRRPERHPRPNSSYNPKYPLSPPAMTFRIGVISDLDKEAVEKRSKIDGRDELTGKWVSLLREGSLTLKPNRHDPQSFNISVEWDEERVHRIHSGLNYGGRGMELSTLNVFNGHLYACDDKTGVVYELPISDTSGIDPIPWTILADGNFTGPSGFKCEWATIKDNDIWVGGHGTSLKKKDGSITEKQKFVKKITPTGEVTHLDWRGNFDKMAEALGIHFPGYVTHEAAGWSKALQKWIFMPRKISKEKFEEYEDAKKGSNIVLLADEDFVRVQVGHIGDLIPTHGFASFKFVPGTGDQIILAIKSVESGNVTQTYIMAFDLKGNILLPETKFADRKYEGIEFI